VWRMSTRGLDGGDTGKFLPATAGLVVRPRFVWGGEPGLGAAGGDGEHPVGYLREQVWPGCRVWLGFLGPITSLRSNCFPGGGCVSAGGVVVGCLLRCG
jgi:hypothetical protein